MTEQHFNETSTSDAVWQVVGASVVGTGHVKAGLPCQDAFDHKTLHETLIVAVADGAGSAALSAEGSQLAVSVATKSLTVGLRQHLPSDGEAWRSLMQTTFEEARQALIEEAANAKHPLREYATTLLLVILTDEWTVSGLVGDCLAVRLAADETLTVLNPPQKGEYANTTNFLTQDEALANLDIQSLHEKSFGIAAFSDGLQTLAVNMAHNKPHTPFFSPLFAFIEAMDDATQAQQQLAEFLNSARVNDRTDDDKTIVIARRCNVR